MIHSQSDCGISEMVRLPKMGGGMFLKWACVGSKPLYKLRPSTYMNHESDET